MVSGEECAAGVAEQRSGYSGDGFRSLRVWQEAKALTVRMYKLSGQGGLAKDYGLRDQMRRAAVSICSNIAEGDERGSNRESARFLYIAKGSLAELRTQVEVTADVGYISQAAATEIDKVCAKIANMLGALIKTRTVS